jgi:hypothetical protein
MNCMVLSECDGPSILPHIFLLCCLVINLKCREYKWMSTKICSVVSSASKCTHLPLAKGRIMTLVSGLFESIYRNAWKKNVLTSLFVWSTSSLISNAWIIVNTSGGLRYKARLHDLTIIKLSNIHCSPLQCLWPPPFAHYLSNIKFSKIKKCC